MVVSALMSTTVADVLSLMTRSPPVVVSALMSMTVAAVPMMVRSPPMLVTPEMRIAFSAGLSVTVSDPSTIVRLPRSTLSITRLPEMVMLPPALCRAPRSRTRSWSLPVSVTSRPTLVAFGISRYSRPSMLTMRMLPTTTFMLSRISCKVPDSMTRSSGSGGGTTARMRLLFWSAMKTLLPLASMPQIPLKVAASALPPSPENPVAPLPAWTERMLVPRSTFKTRLKFET